jgi:methylamine---glutamate N-methyltransferase subunit C
MDKPVPAQNAPYIVEVTKGERYFYCTCGRSKTQPWCDGAHEGTGIDPIVFVAEETGEVYLCGCQKSKKLPFCDGSHSQS